MTRNKWISRPLGADRRLLPWLIDTGSLTQRIKVRLGDFSVRNVQQRLARVNSDELDRIRSLPGRIELVREVFLCSGERRVVFAHSVLARTSLRGPWSRVGRLGATPLGAELFADACVSRAPLEYRKIRRGNPLFSKACRGLDSPPRFLWARRSLFFRENRPILVTEVFLPALLEQS